ncbi:hypothetical protein Tco_1050781 [Tanacetum coccineum]
MLNKKRQADHWNEICYQLLKLITKQLKNQLSVWKHPPELLLLRNSRSIEVGSTSGIRACSFEKLYKEDMDQNSVHMVAASKVPMLKPGVETIIAPSTAEEKAQRRLELKARSTL